MRLRVGEVPADAARLLPAVAPDASDIGVNYADAYLKIFKQTLEDGRKLLCKRRGLKLTLKIGDRQGEGLMRRLEHGPDVEEILRQALREAAAAAGARFSVDDGTVYLEID
jgi:hypothetical protein